jgi:choline-sulfatase
MSRTRLGWLLSDDDFWLTSAKSPSRGGLQNHETSAGSCARYPTYLDGPYHRSVPSTVTRATQTRTTFDKIVLVSLDTCRADLFPSNPVNLWRSDFGLESLRLDLGFLDEVADEAAFFANCIAAAPYTSASHATVLTGRFPLHHGVFEFFNRALRSWTLFHSAHRVGYRTILKTDFPVILGPALGFTREVDDFIVEDDDAYLDALSAVDQSLSLLHFGSLHLPYGFHTLRYGGQAYESKVTELEASIGPSGDRQADRLSETFRDERDSDLLLRYKHVVQKLYLQGNYTTLMRLYLEGAEFFVHTRLSQVWERLSRALAGSRHLIVVFGDHGEHYDGETYGHYNSVHEGVARVPLLFLGTGVAPGMHTTRVRTADVMPTLLTFLGEDRGRRTFDGSSLASTILFGEPYEERDALCQAYVAEIDALEQAQERVRSGRTKTSRVPHLLVAEAAYSGDYKLTRRPATIGEFEGRPQRAAGPTTLERISASGRFEGARDPAAARHLAARLDEYNQARDRWSRREETVSTPEIAAHLRDMGYRI